MTPKQLREMNFSLWCDFVQRDFLDCTFSALLAQSDSLLNGATSNPSIFATALQSPQYAQQKESLRGLDSKSIYEHLAFADIAKAADILAPLHRENAHHGFVSIEIDPFLCDDAPRSIDEGVRIFETLNKPNVMIKVPATQAGYEVMSALLARSIPVNATLIFSPAQAKACMEAFALARKHSLAQAVVSIFVSRIDRAYGGATLGIANAKECYACIQDFDDHNSRALFASTGVKGGDLPPTYYIDSLLLPNAINTAPLDALKAFLGRLHTPEFEALSVDDRIVKQTCGETREPSRIIHYDKLLDEGLVAFKQSFSTMLESL